MASRTTDRRPARPNRAKGPSLTAEQSHIFASASAILENWDSEKVMTLCKKVEWDSDKLNSEVEVILSNASHQPESEEWQEVKKQPKVNKVCNT
jgi:hypothetical protein